ncbi:MAG: hypothetical protein CM15mP68_3860 [Pseudomonadota bacterium]|nr:MAG: hypothetical protein CM15mP68_3860 [Pseudomonadota bacterium]
MAGRIPQQFINDLIDRADIVSVIEDRITLKKTGKNYSGLCPFHDEKTPSFSVSPDKQFFPLLRLPGEWHCSVLHNEVRTARVRRSSRNVGAELGMESQRQGRNPTVKVDEDLYTVLQQAERSTASQLRSANAAVDYLKGRGLTGEIARDFGIGYAPAEWHGVADALVNERVSETNCSRPVC